MPKRKQNRLQNFDYSTPGAYFITICTEGCKNLLCNIVGDGFPVPKPQGKIAEKYILEIPAKYPGVIGWYKYHVTKEINAEMGAPGNRFFQRSYHDHVIRGEKDYQKIWRYIEDSPMKWAEDCFYTQ